MFLSAIELLGKEEKTLGLNGKSQFGGTDTAIENGSYVTYGWNLLEKKWV